MKYAYIGPWKYALFAKEKSIHKIAASTSFCNGIFCCQRKKELVMCSIRQTNQPVINLAFIFISGHAKSVAMDTN